jgi:broad specificity phosphatase PhoE
MNASNRRGAAGPQQEAAGQPWETAVQDRLLLSLARHAQPAGDDGRRRFTGQADPPLGVTGLEQAQLLALELHEYGFEAVYSSDLQRSAQTAAVLAEHMGVPLRQEPRLREIDTGRWEGLTAEEARGLYPTEYAEREADLLGYRFPGGESFRQLEARVVQALDDIGGQGLRRVAIVAHLGVNRVLLCHLTGRPLERIFDLKQDYCAYELVWLSRALGPSNLSAQPRSSAPPSGSGGR